MSDHANENMDLFFVLGEIMQVYRFTTKFPYDLSPCMNRQHLLIAYISKKMTNIRNPPPGVMALLSFFLGGLPRNLLLILFDIVYPLGHAVGHQTLVIHELVSHLHAALP